MNATSARVAHSPIALIPSREVAHSTRAVRSGELTPVIRGVYARSAEWTPLAPWDRYLARVHAAVLLTPDAVLCRESAAAVRGYPVFGDPGTVHVLALDGEQSRVSRDVVVHSTVEPRAIHSLDGVLVTSAADTVVDIARSSHNALALAVADVAVREDSALTADALARVNESRLSSRGRRHARWAIDRASPLAESALESVDRAVIEWLGFPDPELQKWIGRDRVDKWWAERSIAGESDGDLKYAREADVAAAMKRRHERDARLFRNGARAVPHWSWSEAIAADPLYALLTSAGLRPIAARNTAQLFSLRRALRRP